MLRKPSNVFPGATWGEKNFSLVDSEVLQLLNQEQTIQTAKERTPLSTEDQLIEYFIIKKYKKQAFFGENNKNGNHCSLFIVC